MTPFSLFHQLLNRRLMLFILSPFLALQALARRGRTDHGPRRGFYRGSRAELPDFLLFRHITV